MDVLAELGFEILSAGVRFDPLSRTYYGAGRLLGRVSWLGRRVSYHGRRLPGGALAEYSVCIDVDEDVDAAGHRVEKDADRLWAEFVACRAARRTIGIMLHHDRYADPTAVDVLRTFLRRVKGEAGVRFGTIGDFAAEDGLLGTAS